MVRCFHADKFWSLHLGRRWNIAMTGGCHHWSLDNIRNAARGNRYSGTNRFHGYFGGGFGHWSMSCVCGILRRGVAVAAVGIVFFRFMRRAYRVGRHFDRRRRGNLCGGRFDWSFGGWGGGGFRLRHGCRGDRINLCIRRLICRWGDINGSGGFFRFCAASTAASGGCRRFAGAVGRHFRFHRRFFGQSCSVPAAAV